MEIPAKCNIREFLEPGLPSFGEVMSLCARVVVIDHGAVLIEDVPAVVAKDRRVIEAYLGQEIDVPA